MTVFTHTWVVCGKPSKEVKGEFVAARPEEVAFLDLPLPVQRDVTKLDDVFRVSASRQTVAEGSGGLPDAESINNSSDLLVPVCRCLFRKNEVPLAFFPVLNRCSAKLCR